MSTGLKDRGTDLNQLRAISKCDCQARDDLRRLTRRLAVAGTPTKIGACYPACIGSTVSIPLAVGSAACTRSATTAAWSLRSGIDSTWYSSRVTANSSDSQIES